MKALRCQLEGVSVGWRTGAEVLVGVDLDLELNRESFLPLMGLSGEGKSTLLYVIAALKWPATGRVRWSFPQRTFHWGNGGLSEHEATLIRRRYFGFVFQDSTLSPQLRVAENLEYPLMLKGDISLQARRSHVARALQDVQLEECGHKFPHELSGGERQRVALAQAMISDPDVLFADEPGGNLDPETRAGILRTLKSWVEKNRGSRALIWITHNLDDSLELGSKTALRIGGQRCEHKDQEWLEQCRQARQIL